MTDLTFGVIRYSKDLPWRIKGVCSFLIFRRPAFFTHLGVLAQGIGFQPCPRSLPIIVLSLTCAPEAGQLHLLNTSRNAARLYWPWASPYKPQGALHFHHPASALARMYLCVSKCVKCVASPAVASPEGRPTASRTSSEALAAGLMNAIIRTIVRLVNGSALEQLSRIDESGWEGPNLNLPPRSLGKR